MSSGDPVKGIAVPPTKSKPKEKERKRQTSGNQSQERLKTVVRRLPPNLPEDVFWQSVRQWITEDTVTWKVYHQGKFRKRLNKENIPSRAYIAFKDEETLATFSREYDGHLFRDKAGNESIAIVEFAPFQKIPSEKKKVDGRIATIEKDEDYISFLDSLKDSSTKPFDVEKLETIAAATQPAPAPTTTPLLEALKAEKSAQKDKEAILRNHAHYKDHTVAPVVPGPSSKKEEVKKKAPPTAPAQQKPAEQPSRRAVKKAAAAAKAAQQVATVAAAAPSKQVLQPNPSQAQASTPAPSAPSTPKVARIQRERQQSKPAPKLVVVDQAPPTANASASAAGTPTPGSAPLPAVAPRRMRPMLGLASRQFEAALSGAGVDRKPRREREEQEMIPAGEVGIAKGRVMEEGAVGNLRQVHEPQQAAAPAPPTILQRDGQGPAPTIFSRPMQGPVPAEPGSGNQLRGESPVSPLRGGRGRGRARGRGARGG